MWLPVACEPGPCTGESFLDKLPQEVLVAGFLVGLLVLYLGWAAWLTFDRGSRAARVGGIAMTIAFAALFAGTVLT